MPPRRHGFHFWAAVWAVSMVALAAGIAVRPTLGEPGGPNRDVPRPLASTNQDIAPDHPGNRRLREGTELVEHVGHFEMAKERLVFVSDRGGVRLVGLENLNLERISQTIANSPSQLTWKISGIVTEFRGTNYLLVRRALLKTATY
jgi:hypothetical protein